MILSKPFMRQAKQPVVLVVLVFALFSLYFLTQSPHPNTFASDKRAYQRENATLVTLCRNDDLGMLLDTIRTYEDRFNHRYHYDWVFLNNDPFTPEFESLVSNLVSGKAKFGIIPKEMWSYPSFIDQEKARQSREKLASEGVLYGESESYRHMCRFQSGFFYRHPLVAQYRYYWRADGDTRLHCDINYDVFKYMRENNKFYSFVIVIYEYLKTIPTLWEHTQDFLTKHPDYIAEDNLINFISNDQGQTYNLCHFWSNFELADADFLRGPMFSKYFDYLDATGGFFYERWGDAPVHSMAAALFLNKDEVHFFEDIGFSHNPYQHVPANFVERGLKCSQQESKSFDWDGYSCMRQYYRAMNLTLPVGVEPLDP